MGGGERPPAAGRAEGSLIFPLLALIAFTNPYGIEPITVNPDPAYPELLPEVDKAVAMWAEGAGTLDRGVQLVVSTSPDADIQLRFTEERLYSLEGEAAGLGWIGTGTTRCAPAPCEAYFFKQGHARVSLASTTPDMLAYVIAHELGHALGLDHATDRSSVMFPMVSHAEPQPGHPAWETAKTIGAGIIGLLILAGYVQSLRRR